MVLHTYDVDDDNDDGKKLHKSSRHPSLSTFSVSVFLSSITDVISMSKCDDKLLIACVQAKCCELK